MACGCMKNRNVEIKGFAIVSDVTLANTPNLIPEEDKYATIQQAQAAQGDRFVVAIVG